MKRIDLADLNSNGFKREDFVIALGAVFEHSPWIANQAWPLRPFADVGVLHEVMVGIMRQSDKTRQLALICAHPQLAGKAALQGELTRELTLEQASAGLDQCSAEELAEISQLNAAYQSRFGFPFIMAMKGLSKSEIFTAFRQRLENDPDAEFEQALSQIERIALLRLQSLLMD